MDSSTMMFIIAYGVIMVIGIIVFLVYNHLKKLQRRGVIKTSIREYIFLTLYQKYDGFFLTTNQLNVIKKNVQAMCVYSPRDTYIVCAQYMTVFLATILVFFAAAVIFYDDIISIALCAAFGMFFASSQIDKKLDKVNLKVYGALRGALSAIREGYLRTNSVPESIEEADIDPLLKDNFDSIYNILTTANAEVKLKEFFERVPFRHLQTLARVCYDINNSGDEVDSTGHSNFLEAMSTMSEDVVAELDKIHYQQDEFGNMEYLTVIPFFAMKPIEQALGNTLPATSVIYDSSMGYVLRIGVMISVVVAFAIITKINTVQAVKDDDRVYFFSKITQTNQFVKRFAEDIAPKNYAGYSLMSFLKTKKMGKVIKNDRDKFQKKLDKAMSKKTPEAFYLEKFTYAMIIGIGCCLAIYLSVQIGYQKMLANTNPLSIVGVEFSVEISQDQLVAMDTEYIRLKKENQAPKGEALSAFCESYLPGLTDMEIEDQVKRLESKWNTLENCYFQWYYIWISVVAAFVGWMYPNMMLILRKWLIQVEAEADFIQMQTLMSITMNTDADTLDALEQMSEMTQIHKSIMLYCYHSFPSAPDKELARLQAQTPLMEFKRFIGKMRLTTEDLSLREAFSDLKLEREYIQKERDRKVRQSIHKKATLCGFIFKVPLVVMIFGDLLYPLAYIGITEFQTTMASVNG